ncbi:MAG: TlpA family protein disulfide reductase [Flavobacteriaceae bacterium]|jgi:thiol-disulfide isomerase/thioredoxin|nr:TlpA family protein disulfide reductase [Flavobacteriaceae bacterium]
MKKYFLLSLVALFAISCSKKVEVSGKITGGLPLERIEFTEASGVGTLPLINLGMDKDGNFSGTFEAPKNGMYFMSYAGRKAMVYLKGGQKFQFTANNFDFPESLKISGDAKNNNDFLQGNQKFLAQYVTKINMRDLLSKDEAAFIKEVQKILTDVEKNIDSIAKKTKADSEVAKFKKAEIKASLLTLLVQYEQNHAMAIQNPNFKVSGKFKDFEKSLIENSDELVRNQPIFRNYLLGKIANDFQSFAQTNKTRNPKDETAETFSKFLDTRKDLSQTAKDYLLAFILSEYEISPVLASDEKKLTPIKKIIDEKIKDQTVKSDMQKLLSVIAGLKIGEPAPEVPMIKQDGKPFKFADAKGKPVLVMFYASWNPYIAESTVPVLKEVVNFYKSKMDFVYINLDDSKNQFIKTSNAMLKGISGTNVYAEGGMSSELAKKFGIYGFKLPSFIVLDKDGKIASQSFFELGDNNLVNVLDKQTGLKAPVVSPEIYLQNDLLQGAK